MKILIIGYGVVGQNMHKIFPHAEIHDPGIGRYGYPRIDISAPFDNPPVYMAPRWEEFDVAFVCVPTEMNEDGHADTSIVESVVKEHADHVRVFCIKSTVPPETTQGLIDRGYRCVMSPEYFGATQHANAVDYDFVVLGGLPLDRVVVAQAYEEVKSAHLRIFQTDATTAEVIKYMENAWLATKVTFCNEFARIADTFGVDYRELREGWLLDPRVNPSHTFVNQDNPGWNSHCLNKDVPAIITASIDAGYEPGFLIDMMGANKIYRGGLDGHDTAEPSSATTKDSR